jgi:hypothetical protein
MSLMETAEERRARFLRLAIAAAVTAAKVPLPRFKAAYLKVAQNLRSEADRLGQTGSNNFSGPA